MGLHINTQGEYGTIPPTAVNALERFRDWLFGQGTPSDEAIGEAHRALYELLLCFARYAFETSEHTADTNRQRWQALAEAVPPNRIQEIPRKACEYRRAEQSFVINQMNDLRDLAWTLIGGMSQLIQQESEDNNALSSHIQHLNQQLRSGEPHIPVEALKSTLLSLTEVVQERERRHQQVRNQLQTQVHHLMQELEQARRESALDPLTQLFNRRALDAQLQHMIQLHQLFGYPMTLILLDIDHFKQVNDQYGHLAGDEVLKEIARRLVSVCKRKGDFVARYGGEEFAVMLRETTLREGKAVAQRIADAIRSETVRVSEELELAITVSLGVSQLQAGESAEEWLQRTDQRLYQAKHEGRNRMCA